VRGPLPRWRCAPRFPAALRPPPPPRASAQRNKGSPEQWPQAAAGARRIPEQECRPRRTSPRVNPRTGTQVALGVCIGVFYYSLRSIGRSGHLALPTPRAGEKPENGWLAGWLACPAGEGQGRTGVKRHRHARPPRARVRGRLLACVRAALYRAADTARAALSRFKSS